MDEHILIRYYENKATAQEKKQIEKWLASDDNKTEKDILLERLWKKENCATVSDQQLEKSLDFFATRIHGENRKKKKFASHAIAFYMKIAAALLIPLLAGGIIGSMLTNYVISDAYTSVEYVTGTGESRQITLPDGSTVWLNSKSFLITTDAFSKSHRDVYLVGEGYFKVAKNEHIPFIVRTPYLSVKAVGTEFNVRCYQNEKIIHTSLSEGCVKVKINGFDESAVTLKPSEQARFVEGDSKIEIVNINLTPYLAWKDGKLIFEKTPFTEIIQRIENHYGKKIVYQNNLFEKTYISAKFNMNESLEHILNALSEVAYFKYYEQDDIIYIIAAF